MKWEIPIPIIPYGYKGIFPSTKRFIIRLDNIGSFSFLYTYGMCGFEISG